MERHLKRNSRCPFLLLVPPFDMLQVLLQQKELLSQGHLLLEANVTSVVTEEAASPLSRDTIWSKICSHISEGGGNETDEVVHYIPELDNP